MKLVCVTQHKCHRARDLMVLKYFSRAFSVRTHFKTLLSHFTRVWVHFRFSSSWVFIRQVDLKLELKQNDRGTHENILALTPGFLIQHGWRGGVAGATQAGPYYKAGSSWMRNVKKQRYSIILSVRKPWGILSESQNYQVVPHYDKHLVSFRNYIWLAEHRLLICTS